MKQDGEDGRQDLLGEAGNIGAGRAAMALETMLGRGSVLLPPRVGRGAPPVGILEAALDLGDPLDVEVLVVYGTGAVHHLLEDLAGGVAADITKLGPMEASVLSETANILASAYLNALAELTGLRLVPSPPRLRVGGRLTRQKNETWTASRLRLRGGSEVDLVLRLRGEALALLIEALQPAA